MRHGLTTSARRWSVQAALAATLFAALSALPLPAVGEPWTSLGPPGGQVQSLAVTAGGTVVAGTAYGGVFRSNAGVSGWTAASLLDFPIPNPIALAPDPADRATVYAATGTLWKSGDGGRTWRQISVQPVIALSVCAASHLTFYAVGDHQVWRSDDGGATLRELAADLPHQYVTIAADPQDPETAYISTDGGVFKTTDGGANWIAPGPLNQTFKTLLADPASPGTLYAESASAIADLSVTHDGAQTWTHLTADLPVPQCRQPGRTCSLTALALSPPPRPGSPSILHMALNFEARQHSGQFLGTIESLLARSADGGVTWTTELDVVEVDTVNDHESVAITAIAVDPRRTQRMFAAVGSTGVMTTMNSGASWQLSNAGLIANVVTAVVQDPHTAGALTLGSQGLGVLASSNGGTAWKSADNGLGAATPASRLVADPARAGVLYAFDQAGVYKSRDFGASWRPLSIPIGANDLAVDPHRPGTLVAVGSTQVTQCPTLHCPTLTFVAAASSSDGGNSWVSLQGSMGLAGAMGELDAVRFDPLHPRTVLVAGDLSFKSTDLGATWERLPLGPGIADLAIDDDGPGHYYAADPLRNAVDVSTDGGATWVPSAIPLPAGTVPLALALDPFHAGVIYLGGEGGVFVSRDSGRSWESLDDGLPHLPVMSLAVSTFQETVLYAGTAGRGLFSLTLR
jgi:photosystem II stability/assembly factor-like uncharacterized protein